MSETSAFIAQQGGPEVIQWRDADLPPPGPGEVQMRGNVTLFPTLLAFHVAGTILMAGDAFGLSRLAV